MAHPWAQAGSYNLASTSSRGLISYLGYDSFFGRFTADNDTTPRALNAQPHSTDRV